MSTPNHVEDELRRIWSFIDNGEFENAESSLREIEDGEENLENPFYKIVKSQYWIELGELEKASEEIARLKTEIDTYGTLVKVNILAMSARIKLLESEFAISEKEIHEVYRLFDALNVTEKENNAYIMADMANLEGLILLSTNQFEEAILKFDTSRIGHAKLNRPKQQGMVAYNTGKSYQLLENIDRALVFYEEAVNHFQAMNYIEGIDKVYAEIIQCYQSKQDRDMVYIYEQRQRDLKEKLEFNNFKLQTFREKNALNDHIFSLNQEIDKLEQEVWNLKFEVEAVQTSSAKGLTNVIASNKAEEYDQLAEKLDTLMTENKMLFGKVKDYEVEVNDYKLKKLEQDQVISETSEMLSTIQEELHKQKKENQNYKEEKEQLENEISDLKNQIEVLKAENEILKENRVKATEKLKKGAVSENKEVETLNQMLDELEAQNEELIIEKKKLETENKELTEILQRTEETLIERETEITNVQLAQLDGEDVKFQEMSNKISTLTAERDELQKTNSSMKGELEGATKKIDSMEKEIEKLKEQYKDSTQNIPAIQEVQNQLLELQKEYQKVQNELKKKEATPETSQEEVAAIRDDLSNEKKISRNLSDEITSLKADIASLKKDNQKQTSDFDKRMKQKDKELLSLQDQLKETKHKLETAQTEAEELKNVIEVESQKASEKNQATQPSKMTTQAFIQYNPAELSLDELLATDKLMSSIYTTIESRKKVKTRQLAMQLGISTDKCGEIVDQLVELGHLIKMDDSKNPYLKTV